jgi:hypothetical protein
MKKDFIVSKIEAPQDGSQYVLIAFTDSNEPKPSGGGGAGSGYPHSHFSKSDEALPIYLSRRHMKNLPKVMSNMSGTGGGMPGNSPTFKITMKEYEDMAIKVGDKVGIEIKKTDSSGV